MNAVIPPGTLIRLDWLHFLFHYFSIYISLYGDFYIAIVSHLIAYNIHLVLGLIYFRTERWTNNILEKVFPGLVGQEIKYSFSGDSQIKKGRKNGRKELRKEQKQIKEKMDITILFVRYLFLWRFPKHTYLSYYMRRIGNWKRKKHKPYLENWSTTVKKLKPTFSWVNSTCGQNRKPRQSTGDGGHSSQSNRSDGSSCRRQGSLVVRLSDMGTHCHLFTAKQSQHFTRQISYFFISFKVF